MGLPFDDWIESDGPQNSNQPGGIESLAWFEVEASGPGKINRLATVTGILLTQIADSRDIGDGTITLDTGYGLNPNSDQWAGLTDGQNGPLVSCYLVLSSIGGQDDLATGGDRNGWLESVSANFQSVGNTLELFLTIKANLDGDIAFMRIGYQVVLLFNSNRPPAMMLRAILVGGVVRTVLGQMGQGRKSTINLARRTADQQDIARKPTPRLSAGDEVRKRKAPRPKRRR